MKYIETSVEIEAPSEDVWATLIDFESYPEWNPFIQRVDGEPAAGERLTVRIQPPGGRGMTFKPRVTGFTSGERLEWLGKLGIPGLFDGRHEFRLQRIDESRTRLLHRETFSGLLVRLFLDEDATHAGFESMNEALKARVEGRKETHEGITAADGISSPA